MKTFVCSACLETDPCILRVGDGASGPDSCPYGGAVAKWDENRPKPSPIIEVP